jgi:hypothetical protein
MSAEFCIFKYWKDKKKEMILLQYKYKVRLKNGEVYYSKPQFMEQDETLRQIEKLAMERCTLFMPIEGERVALAVKEEEIQDIDVVFFQ